MGTEYFSLCSFLCQFGCAVKLANSHDKMTFTLLRKVSGFVYEFEGKEKKKAALEKVTDGP